MKLEQKTSLDGFSFRGLDGDPSRLPLFPETPIFWVADPEDLVNLTITEDALIHHATQLLALRIPHPPPSLYFAPFSSIIVCPCVNWTLDISPGVYAVRFSFNSGRSPLPTSSPWPSTLARGRGGEGREKTTAWVEFGLYLPLFSGAPYSFLS